MENTLKQTSSGTIELSVVIPVYECGPCLNELYRRLVTVLEENVASFELVFIDDRARDDSWEILKTFANIDNRVIIIRLSRNYGQQLAISAGIKESHGDKIIVMDCDLQDPPEFIPRLLEAAKDGIEIVFARRKSDYNSKIRIWLGKIYFRFLSILCDMHFSPDIGSFSLITRKVAREFNRFRDIDRHYQFILKWLGFEIRYIEFDRSQRNEGKSAYSLRNLIGLGLSGIFFQTTVFLRWVVLLGLIVSALGMLSIIFYIMIYVMGAKPPPGWTTLIIVNLFLGGIIIISVGTVGLYVAKIFDHVKDRPLYVIDEIIKGGYGKE